MKPQGGDAIMVTIDHVIRKTLFFSSPEQWDFQYDLIHAGNGTWRFKFQVSPRQETPTDWEIGFHLPGPGVQYFWYPNAGRDLRLRNVWEEDIPTMTSVGAPVFCLLDCNGENRLTITASETKKPLFWCIGEEEESAGFVVRVRYPADCFAKGNVWKSEWMLDERNMSLPRILRTVQLYWEEECGKSPMETPPEAFESVYSTWYSYHQYVTAEAVENECRLASTMGMKTVILDDGWQTGNETRGYEYCGDWEVYKPKFPDMKAHVQRVHDMGMKYMVWFSVPFVGKYSKVFPRFKNKLLHFQEDRGAGVLDPRYPDVREYLVSIYKDRMQAYGWDGLKLDFIDEFHMWDDTPAFLPGMDCACVQEGVEKLMIAVREAVLSVCSHAMIEFRQRYIGPDMRRFGNMFRVTDCPMDLLCNRTGMVNLRMLSGDTAVHSDMLQWHPSVSAEEAARQIWNVLFGVVQISVRLADMSPEQEKMMRFLLRFRRENRDILLHERLHVQDPSALCPVVWAMGPGRVIALCSESRTAACLPAEKSLCLVNTSGRAQTLLQLQDSGRYHVTFYTCQGDRCGEATVTLKAGDVVSLPVPVCGLAEMQFDRE